MEKKLELLDLPIELIGVIFQQLDYKSINKLCRISRAYRELRRSPIIFDIILGKKRSETLVGKVKRTITQFKDRSIMGSDERDEVFFFFNNFGQPSTLGFCIDREIQGWLPCIFHLIDDLEPNKCLIEQHHDVLVGMRSSHNLPYLWCTILLSQELQWGLGEDSDKETAVLRVLRTFDNNSYLTFRMSMPLFRGLMELHMEIIEEKHPMVGKLYADGSRKKKIKEIGIIETIYDDESSEE